MADIECRLHHVAVGSSDVERLASFYVDVLGLRENARHFDGGGALRSIWLDLGGPLLMIERTNGPARHVEGIGTGPFLLAFRISKHERSEVERRLELGGHRIESRTVYTSYARDVDGNPVAISHYPEH